tara:strand:- start:11292 stop:12572 length:1281 start_codon:yes stop_codon:yes gene_type:complete
MDSLNLNKLKKIVLNLLIDTDKQNFIIGLSGGVDSMLLLHVVNEIKSHNDFNIRAIHINHHISKNNNLMEQHCIDACNEYHTDLVIKNITEKKKNNIEEFLRNKRYNLIFDTMNKDEALLLGHHQNDQVETFFYRLFRGSSPKGLSLMKKISYRNDKLLCRPFLSLGKENITKLSQYLNIKFIKDLSNDDMSFDRNYIRSQIIPPIVKRWDTLNNIMEHNIELQDTYSKIVNDYCESIYNSIISNNTLCINSLKRKPIYLYGTFLKYWINKKIQYDLSKNEIYNLIKLIQSNNNDYPKCELKNKVSLIRYDNKLHIIKLDDNHLNEPKSWDLQSDIKFGYTTITLNELKDKGLYEKLYNKAPFILKSVTGNEKIMLNSNYYQDLKKIFQNKSIPTWEREKFVLFFSNHELLLAYSNKHIFISSEIR